MQHPSAAHTASDGSRRILEDRRPAEHVVHAVDQNDLAEAEVVQLLHLLCRRAVRILPEACAE
jgi:hypothetical protein